MILIKKLINLASKKEKNLMKLNIYLIKKIEKKVLNSIINIFSTCNLTKFNNKNRFLDSNDEIDLIKNYYQKFTKIKNKNNLKDEELKIAQNQ